MIDDQHPDHYCAYQIGDNQCPLPGSISSGLSGGSNFYCQHHYRTINNPPEARRILFDLIGNQSEVQNYNEARNNGGA